MGIDQSEMRDEGLIFAVRRVEADYLAPARFDDELTVTTSTRQMTGARLVLDQVVARGDEVLFEAVVTIVCLTVTGQPARLPAHLRQSVH
jgi:acyl-CoA thioester hydrolase